MKILAESINLSYSIVVKKFSRMSGLGLIIKNFWG